MDNPYGGTVTNRKGGQNINLSFVPRNSYDLNIPKGAQTAFQHTLGDSDEQLTLLRMVSGIPCSIYCLQINQHITGMVSCLSSPQAFKHIFDMSPILTSGRFQNINLKKELDRLYIDYNMNDSGHFNFSLHILSEDQINPNEFRFLITIPGTHNPYSLVTLSQDDDNSKSINIKTSIWVLSNHKNADMYVANSIQI